MFLEAGEVCAGVGVGLGLGVVGGVGHLQHLDCVAMDVDRVVIAIYYTS